jgi:hypothetical protein
VLGGGIPRKPQGDTVRAFHCLLFFSEPCPGPEPRGWFVATGPLGCAAVTPRQACGALWGVDAACGFAYQAVLIAIHLRGEFTARWRNIVDKAGPLPAAFRGPQMAAACSRLDHRTWQTTGRAERSFAGSTALPPLVSGRIGGDVHGYPSELCRRSLDRSV